MTDLIQDFAILTLAIGLIFNTASVQELGGREPPKWVKTLLRWLRLREEK